MERMITSKMQMLSLVRVLVWNRSWLALRVGQVDAEAVSASWFRICPGDSISLCLWPERTQRTTDMFLGQ